MQYEILWGIFGQDSDNAEANKDVELYLDSYVNMMTLITGVAALFLSLLGCCTSKSKDRCSVALFTLLSLALFAVFAVISIGTMTLHFWSE